MRLSIPSTILPLLILFAASSCKSGGMKDIDQGEIHFSITYGGPPGNFPMPYLPKNMVVSFKEDRTLFDIRSPFGNNGIANLSNPSEDIYDTYLNMLGTRAYYPSESDETPPGLSSMEGLKIRPTGKTGEIIGFKCKHAEVTLPSMPDSVFDIWYTDEINIKNPNVANPFNEIDGVLLSFFFFMGNREFIFEAESIYRKEIPDKVFDRREKYKRIGKDDMERYIAAIVN